MMRLTPTAPMPSAENRVMAVVRIRSLGLAGTMTARLLLAELGDERKLSLFPGPVKSARTAAPWPALGRRWRRPRGRRRWPAPARSGPRRDGTGGPGRARAGGGGARPRRGRPRGGRGRGPRAGRGQAGGGLVGAAADLGVDPGRPARVAAGEG